MRRAVYRTLLAVPFAPFRSTCRYCSTSQPRSSQRDDDDDDFVNIWANELADDTGGKCLAPVESSTGVVPLGVQRARVPPEDEELSRLRIPITNKRRGQPVPRDGSRAIQQDASGEVALGGDDTIIGADGPDGADEGGDADHSGLHAAEEPLPFDDERFAETILEMEVEGALDEAWQDRSKAHLEDAVALGQILKDLRVRDICAIDVSSKTSNFDYLIVGTCEGVRHMNLAAWAVQEADKYKRVTKVKRQRTDQLWDIIPVGRIIVNLMLQGYRDEVNIERKWAVTSNMDPLQAANAAVSEGRQVKAHGLWTLTLNLQDLEDFEVDYCKDVLISQT